MTSTFPCVACPVCGTEARQTEYVNYYVCVNAHVASDRPDKHGNPQAVIALRIISRPGRVPVRYDFVRVQVGGGKRKTVSVHLLVADTWLPPRPGDWHEVRHLDGNPHHNWATNLAWGTSADNHDDMYRHGTANVGVKNPRARLNDDDVRVVRARLSANESISQIARDFKISRSVIHRIKRGRYWRHVTDSPAGDAVAIHRGSVTR